MSIKETMKESDNRLKKMDEIVEELEHNPSSPGVEESNIDKAVEEVVEKVVDKVVDKKIEEVVERVAEKVSEKIEKVDGGEGRKSPS